MSQNDVTTRALMDASDARDKLEAMRSRFAPGQNEPDKPLDDYDRMLLGSPVVQVRMNMALASRDVLHQLRAIRSAAERAIAILESHDSTSAQRRIMAKRVMEAARDTVRDTRRAAGEENAK
jgi:hypothetical protein